MCSQVPICQTSGLLSSVSLREAPPDYRLQSGFALIWVSSLSKCQQSDGCGGSTLRCFGWTFNLELRRRGGGAGACATAQNSLCFPASRIYQHSYRLTFMSLRQPRSDHMRQPFHAPFSTGEQWEPPGAGRREYLSPLARCRPMLPFRTKMTILSSYV